MNRQMRNACLLGVFAIVAAWLAPGVRAEDAAKPVTPPQNANAAMDALKLLPQEAKDQEFVGCTDLGSMLRGKGMQGILRAMQAMQTDAEPGIMTQFLKLGLEDKLGLVAFAGTIPADGKEAGVVCVVTGTFEQEAIHKGIAAAMPEAAPFEFEGCKLLGTPAGEKGRFEAVFGVVDGKTLVIGTEELARKAIAVCKGKSPSLPETAEVVAALKKMESKPLRINVTPAVVPVDVWTKPPFQGKLDASKLKSLTVSGNMKETVLILEGTILADSPESAAVIKAILNEAREPKGDPMAMAMGNPVAMALTALPEPVIEGSSIKLTLKDLDLRVMVGMFGPMQDSLFKARADAREAKCKNNLKQIGAALQQYLDGPGEHRYFPRKLKDLIDSKILIEPIVYLCPEDPYDSKEWHCSYGSVVEVTDKKLSDRLPSDAIVIWDDKPRHNGKRCVGFNDTHVESVTEDQFQDLLGKVKKMIAEQK